MIDITKPLELTDGTPVTFLYMSDCTDYIVARRAGHSIEARMFHPVTGKHRYGKFAALRNKQEPVAPVTAVAVPKAAPLDLTKPVETRGGRKVRILATDRKGASYPVAALVHSSCKTREIIRSYTLDGRHLGNNQRSHLDLVNVEPEEVRFYPAVAHAFLSAEGVRKAYGANSDVIAVTRKGGKIIAVEANASPA